MTRGFTLIELLVLIAIIGILTAAVIANMNRAKIQAFNAAALGCAQDIRNQQKIAQTTEKRFVTYADLPAKTACRPLEAVDATPTGSATELQYAYQTRHPRGNKTYVVTDADVYTDGVGAQGQVLSADPAAPLLTGAPSGPVGPITAGNSLADCEAQSMNTAYEHLDGNLNGTVTYRLLDQGVAVQTKTFTRLAPDVALHEEGGFTRLIVAARLPNGSDSTPAYYNATLEPDGRVTADGATRTLAEWVDLTRTNEGGTTDQGDVTRYIYYAASLTFPLGEALPLCAPYLAY